MVKVLTTNEWKLCGIQDETVTILKDDGEWIKELVQNIRNCTKPEIIRQAEREFHSEMTDRYGGHISGALLMYVWDKTKKQTD